MDKLNIYDLFSFLLPGIVFSFLILQILPVGFQPFNSAGQFADGLIFSIVSLILGLAVHRFNFYLLHFEWYKYILYPSIYNLVNNPKRNLDFSRIMSNEQFNEDSEAYFDKNYYILEKDGKNARIESFQGYYFFFRNLFWVILFSSFAFLIFSNPLKQEMGWIKLIILCIILLFVIRDLALFYRSKMVERVLNLSV